MRFHLKLFASLKSHCFWTAIFKRLFMISLRGHTSSKPNNGVCSNKYFSVYQLKKKTLEKIGVRKAATWRIKLCFWNVPGNDFNNGMTRRKLLTFEREVDLSSAGNLGDFRIRCDKAVNSTTAPRARGWGEHSRFKTKVSSGSWSGLKWTLVYWCGLN